MGYSTASNVGSRVSAPLGKLDALISRRAFAEDEKQHRADQCHRKDHEVGARIGGITGAAVQPVQVKLHRARIAGIPHARRASTSAQIGAGSASMKVGSVWMLAHGVGAVVGDGVATMALMVNGSLQ